MRSSVSRSGQSSSKLNCPQEMVMMSGISASGKRFVASAVISASVNAESKTKIP